jgi:sialate O-acetylesterase
MASFNVSGVIWYQGESNAHNAEHYLHAFPALVSSWRRTFKNPEMPFYFAQLSSISRPSWPFFRETQRQLSHSVAHCAMVVTSDLGDSLNVHPARKRPVGERFAQLALANVYQQKIVCSGPEPKGFHQKGERLILQFEHASRLKTADNLPLREFEIAGQDGVFVTAKAAIHGNEIVIQTGIQQVQKIRYGWNPFSRANMVNQAGWPASTFEIEKK